MSFTALLIYLEISTTFYKEFNMTTICYENGYLAGDKKVSSALTEETKVIKARHVIKVGNKTVVAYGLSGVGSWCKTIISKLSTPTTMWGTKIDIELDGMVRNISGYYADIVPGCVLVVFDDRSSAKIFYNNEINQLFIIKYKPNRLAVCGSGAKYKLINRHITMWLASMFDINTGKTKEVLKLF